MAFCIKFDPVLTSEEESLVRKISLYRKKKKLIIDYEKTQKALESLKFQNNNSIEKAKETAEKLVKTGAIAIKDDSKESYGFKRSKTIKKTDSKSLTLLSLKKTRAHLDLDYFENDDESYPPVQPENAFLNTIPVPPISFSKKNKNLEVKPPQPFTTSSNLAAYNRKDPSSYIPKRKRPSHALNSPNNTLYISSLIKLGFSSAISENLINNVFKIGQTLTLPKDINTTNEDGDKKDDGDGKVIPDEKGLKDIGSQIVSDADTSGEKQQIKNSTIGNEQIISPPLPLTITVKNVNFQGHYNRAFLTFESLQIAEEIIKKFHNTMVKNEDGENVQLIVAYARHNAQNVEQNGGTRKENNYNRNPWVTSRQCGNVITTTPDSNVIDIKPESMPIPTIKRRKINEIDEGSIDIEPPQARQNLWTFTNPRRVKAGDENLELAASEIANHNTDDIPLSTTTYNKANLPSCENNEKQESSGRSVVQYEELDIF